MEKLGIIKLASGVTGASIEMAEINKTRHSAGSWELFEDVLTAENTVHVLVMCQQTQRTLGFWFLSFITGSRCLFLSLIQRELSDYMLPVTRKHSVYNEVVQVRRS